MGLKVVTRIRYLGGFMGDTETQDNWLGEKVRVWEGAVHMLAGWRAGIRMWSM